MVPLLIIAGLVIVIFIYAMSVYNRLVKNKTLVEEGWSGIDAVSYTHLDVYKRQGINKTSLLKFLLLKMNDF